MVAHPRNSLDALTVELDELLSSADAELAARYPGDRGVRQPVHTVYVPADRYGERTVTDWGVEAQHVLEQHGENLRELSVEVYERVRTKLATEPIEDLRIDFEDGYGNRPDEHEDAAALAAARALTASLRDGTAAPYHGIRFKSLEAPTRRRGLRTLDLFVGEVARSDALTDRFVVTLPKVTSVDQVRAMVVACERLETAHGLSSGQLRFEIQVETPQSILGADGSVLVAPMIHASAGRCTGLHYGTYDYSASCGIAAAQQSMEHPAADHAKAMMQVAAAGTGVFLSDGSTNVLPVGGRAAVRAAWGLHLRLVRRSLERGFYQGWDLHPAQLPSRFVATYGFYREGLASAAARLRAYVGGGESGFLDEPATAAALAGFVLRGVDCGAVDATEVDELIGVDPDRLAVLARRRVAHYPPVMRFNAGSTDEVTAWLLACCDVPGWADTVRDGRPYGDVDSLLATADRAARDFSREDVDRALAAHPRIGERAKDGSAGASWSRTEQSGVSSDEETKAALLEGNTAYEDRFGRVFLICATGLSAEQILSALRARLDNDDATEAAVVADELRKIALLRLRKLLEQGAGS